MNKDTMSTHKKIRISHTKNEKTSRSKVRDSMKFRPGKATQLETNKKLYHMPKSQLTEKGSKRDI